ncbi:MAG: hypothetical protein AAGF85_13310 [Bacteroidota bacterium]
MEKPSSEDIIKDLKQEIQDHPEQKHRIILKAIKNAQTPELRKVIRKFNQKNL